MNEHNPEPAQSPSDAPSQALEAQTRRTSWLSIVWLVPLVALAIGAWLLYGSLSRAGPEITLYLKTADGIEINQTPVKVLSVNMGRVTHIALNPNSDGVVMKVRLPRSAKNLLRKDTVFWVVKPRIDQSGITGLNTLVSGSYIEFIPGKSEEYADTFTVQDNPPVTPAGVDGLRLKLIGHNDRMLPVGSDIFYRNIPVGKVERADFDPVTQDSQYSVFIPAPNSKLINTNSRFWLSSGLNVRTTGGGVSVDAPSLGAMLSGSISFDTDTNLGKGSPVNTEATFTLYPGRNAMNTEPSQRALYYIAFFEQNIRGLTEGSSVEYKGVPIGNVLKAPYFAKEGSLSMLSDKKIPVLFVIEPSQLELNTAVQDKTVWEKKISEAVGRGLVATVSSDSLLTGSKYLELTDEPAVEPSTRPTMVYAGYAVLPTRVSGLDNTQRQLTNLLIKFNKLPLEKSVNQVNADLAELQKTLKSINAIAGDRSTKALPREVNHTLKSLRQTLAGVSPESPLYENIQGTLKSIDDTLKKTDPLLRQLNQKPNSLIFGPGGNDPIPKGYP